MDISFTYYEEIAIQVCNVKKATSSESLFKKNRLREVVLARQFCMYYRKVVLGYTFRVAGERYGKDHATALHAKKCIKNLKDTRDSDALKFYEFEKRCLKIFKETKVLSKRRREMMTIHMDVERYGFKKLLGVAGRDFLNGFVAIDKYLNEDDSIKQEGEVRMAMSEIMVASKKISELFSYEDNGDLDTENGG